jgi:hypothetical protein
MITVVIGFLRELCIQLNVRADGWAESAGLAAVSGMGEQFALRASVLREVATSIETAMKKTLLA